MFSRLSQFVVRHWLLVIISWLVVVAGVRLVAPRWDDVTYDGDLAFLPPEMPSVRGEKLARAAFPNTRAKSQIVLIAARSDRPLDAADFQLVDAVAVRFHFRLGMVEFARGESFIEKAREQQQSGNESAATELRQLARQAWESSLAAFEEAIRLDEDLARTSWQDVVSERLEQNNDPATDESNVTSAATSNASEPSPTNDAFTASTLNALPIVDVWSRHHEVFGPKLRSEDRQAQLIVLQLSNEFMATDNIRVLGLVENELADVRRQLGAKFPVGLELGISGSAAVGGDMLRAAAQSIRHTEVLTIALVIGILFVVYRSPFVIFVPLVTIAVSLALSTSLLALLTQLDEVPGFEWWGFKVFKTTKIFIIVILFGSGTDFCLFLIARLREELRATNQKIPTAVASGLTKVGDSILASAFTTVLGLATMYFADFGKFRNSGPAIGLCLTVTVLACLTLAPALLCALGKWVFWPGTMEPGFAGPLRSEGRWARIADHIVRRPTPILLFSLLLLFPLTVIGWTTPRRVTFDLLSELSSSTSSMRGNELLKRHFPVGEAGPVMVLVQKRGARFDDDDKDVAAHGMAAIFDLTKSLTEVAGVDSVRSIAEPLGDEPEKMSLITSAGRRKLFLRQHKLTKEIFFAQVPPYRGEITRLELVLNDNPFSRAAMETLTRIDEHLRAESAEADSFWHGAEFLLTGTTAGIRDLRIVTQSDFSRITLLVTASVFGVILLLLRRPFVCLYLIFSVLFSYLVTIGGTELFFRWLYGATFVGLDWKVPIFLFVILVAVGEDYNIYLVTRVFEEQQRIGPFAGLRQAMMRTGGIITSCGLIMAGSFVSMIAGSLRGMVELGFALTCGILLDTLVVRSLLVPAFLAIVFRFRPEVKPREGSGMKDQG
jgi:RND superfamily putative drug exporter